MIPQKIHYCWFGRGEKPSLAKKCIASWTKFCPRYELIEWNEDNFDFTAYPYAQWCLSQKKYAFLSDFVRLVVVEQQGGLYFDTDVELIREPDALLELPAFYGFENDRNVATGLGFGAEAGHPTVRAMKEQYMALKANPDGSYPMVICPKLNTEALLPFGLQLNGEQQIVAGATVFPKEYFNPYDDPTGRLQKTPDTYSIHWYAKSWLGKGLVLRSKLMKPLHRLFGTNFLRRFRA